MLRTKKLFSIILVIALTVTMLTVAGTASSAASDDVITVYYYNTFKAYSYIYGDPYMYAHVWDEKILDTWGSKNQKMEKVTNTTELPEGEELGNWYKYTIDESKIKVFDANGNPKKYASCRVFFYLQYSGYEEPRNGETGYEVFSGINYIKNGIVTTKKYTDNHDFMYSIINNEAVITNYTGTDANIVVPSQIEGYPVTQIANKAFKDCTSIASVNIPSTVTDVGNLAFSSCPNLKTVIISDGGLNRIGDSAFYNCVNLDKITIPKSVETIDRYAFAGCASLNSIAIPESVTSIGESAFSDCFLLTDVYHGGSPTSWEKINIEPGNDSLTNATIHHAKTTPTDTETTTPTTPEATLPTEPITSIPTEPVSTLPTTPAVTYYIGDADCDGKINIKDATAIQKFVAGMETGYPIGEAINQ